jgi:hypothetical protein
MIRRKTRARLRKGPMPESPRRYRTAVMTRRFLVSLVALLLAATVVRNSAVNALADLDPALASAFWSRHPAPEINLAMIEIARAARIRAAAPPEAFGRILDAAQKAPLAPEPFLVDGVREQVAGRPMRAQQAFLAAEWRDPRSLPAHYFLAEHYFRARDAGSALTEIASLANLSPEGVGSSAPYLAAFARDRANWPRMRALFRVNPRIEDAALIELSRDAANAPAILALASPDQRKPDSPWLSVLLDNLVGAGDYAKARAIWASVSATTGGSHALLFDPDFSQPEPPPPFNWALTSSTVGLAERQPGGRLHVIFYGQEDGALARQLLVLPPGRYHLSMRLRGGSTQAKALNWNLTCPGAPEPLASVPLDLAASRGLTFDVPANCRGQWLELSGVASDLPQASDVTIDQLHLVGGPGHA